MVNMVKHDEVLKLWNYGNYGVYSVYSTIFAGYKQRVQGEVRSLRGAMSLSFTSPAAFQAGERSGVSRTEIWWAPWSL